MVIFDKDGRAEGIRLKIVGNLIYTEVRVNGSEPLWFLLDTGAEASMIDIRHQERFSIRTRGGEKIGQGHEGGSFSTTELEHVILSLPGVEITDARIYSYDFSDTKPFAYHELDGLLGYDFFSRFIVELDYVSAVMNVFKHAVYAQPDTERKIHFDWRRNLPVARARAIPLGGGDIVEAYFLLDTGSADSLSIVNDFITDHPTLKKTNYTALIPSRGSSSETRTEPGRIGGLLLGPHRICHPTVSYLDGSPDKLKKTNFAGYIGGEVFRRFDLTINYRDQYIALDPNENFNDPFEFDMTGMYLKTTEPDFRRSEVSEVAEGSPAGMADVRVGDQVLWLNGVDPYEMTDEQWRLIKRYPGNSLTLVLQRDGERFETTFVTKRWM